jgi:hypothetical protein
VLSNISTFERGGFLTMSSAVVILPATWSEDGGLSPGDVVD